MRYLIIENFNYHDNIQIYQNNKLIDFKIISNEGNIIKIDLGSQCYSYELMLNVVNATNYKITFYRSKDMEHPILSKEIENEEVLVLDESWVIDTKTYIVNSFSYPQVEANLNTYLYSTDICRYKEKYIYKYQIKKEYYDNNYYTYIEGYQKDYTDFKVYYNGEPIVNTIEIIQEKIVKQPEYIYIESEIDEQNTENIEYDSSNKTACLPKIETKIITKETYKVPKKIYVIIGLLIITIILLFYLNKRKNVD